MSRPWFPFYVGDYTRDTARLTTEAHGAYLLLMLDYWVNGAPPDDDETLATITKLPVSIWKKRRPALVKFFKVQDGHWVHGRIEKELARAEGVSSARAQAGAEGAQGKWGDSQFDGKISRSQRLAAARAIATHTKEQWSALLDFCGRKCVKCGDEGEMVKDHIKPIYQGGSDGVENLQPLCRSCNSAKGPEVADYRQDGWQLAVEGVTKRLANVRQTPGQSQSQPPLEPESKKGESNSRSDLKLVREGQPTAIDESYQPSERAIEYAFSLGMKKADLDDELRKFIAKSISLRVISFNIDMNFKLWCDRWLEFKRKHNPDWTPPSEPIEDLRPIIVDGTDEHTCWNAYNRERGLRPLFMCKQLRADGTIIQKGARCDTLYPPGFNDFGERVQPASEDAA
ncbi:DUF1376 domain-containing protein [Bradyrhizobium sp. 18]|uniref:DUF1376 domain-containing protein n=1 Tax=Bradyrhizobium sp. 18 TaxID=2782657 RepID=UPI001FF996CF|nr:DUF1376 domain-containing protein [Bradyrhizobium sp. 18]MCK1503878.1 DUF1376 domain-containing protein [Bradyrhizobium sp. 18]